VKVGKGNDGRAARILEAAAPFYYRFDEYGFSFITTCSQLRLLRGAGIKTYNPKTGKAYPKNLESKLEGYLI